MNTRWSRLSLLVITLVVLVAGAPTPVSPRLGADSLPDREPVVVVRVYFHDFAERDRLAVELGAVEVATTGGYLTVWTTAPGYAALQARGLRVEVDEQATQQANEPIQWSSPDTFYNGYHTVEEVYARYDELVTLYPDLVEKIVIGQSWCALRAGGCQISSPALVWDGYALIVLHVTNRAILGPKPVFWYDSDIHAREIATPEVAMRYVEWLLGGYETDANAHWLVDYHDIYVMPIVNPDGHHMVELGNTSPYLVRKNSNYSDGCTYWGSGSGLGTDLNRNFPFLWACCGGSSGTACSEVYRGHAAGSEPEVQAITETLRALFPDQRGPNLTDPAPVTTTGVIQSVHTVANLNLYPWGWSNDPTPNGADLANIAEHMSAVDAGGNGYTPCQPGHCLYNVDGGSFDWQYGELGVPSFSTELGGSGFLPAYSEIEGLWNENKGMLTYLAKIARTPYLLAHGPDANAVTATPPALTFGGFVTVTAAIKYSWTGNAFSQNVAAAEVYVDAPPWAGGTPIPMAAVDGSFNSPLEPARATLSGVTLGAGRHILFVRGRGLSDYAGYPTWGPVSAVFVTVLPGEYSVYMPFVHGE